MPSFLAPLLVVLLPLVGVASLHLFLPVVAPPLMAAAGLEPAAYGLVAGAAGLGSIWFYMSNHGMTPALGPVRTDLKSTMSWRNAGRTGGESLQLECTGQGIVYVQASEEKL